MATATSDYRVRLTTHSEETPFTWPLWVIFLLAAFLSTRGVISDLAAGWAVWITAVMMYTMVKKNVSWLTFTIFASLLVAGVFGIMVLEDRKDIQVWVPLWNWIKTLTPPFNAKFVFILGVAALVEWLWVMVTDMSFSYIEFTPNEFQEMDGMTPKTWDMARVTYRCEYSRDIMVFIFGFGGGDLIVTIDGTEHRYNNIFGLFFQTKLLKIRESKRVTTT